MIVPYHHAELLDPEDSRAVSFNFGVDHAEPLKGLELVGTARRELAALGTLRR